MYTEESRLQQLIDRRLAGSLGSLPEDEEGRKRYPHIWEFLTRVDVNGELAKDPAAITVRLGLGNWLVELTDPTLEIGLTSIARSLTEALEALELTLADPLAPFRPWRRSEPKFRKVNKGTAGPHAGSNITK